MKKILIAVLVLATTNSYGGNGLQNSADELLEHNKPTQTTHFNLLASPRANPYGKKDVCMNGYIYASSLSLTTSILLMGLAIGNEDGPRLIEDKLFLSGVGLVVAAIPLYILGRLRCNNNRYSYSLRQEKDNNNLFVKPQRELSIGMVGTDYAVGFALNF